MMKRQIILVLIIPLILFGCIKDYNSRTSSVVSNTTNHIIRLIPFSQGEVIAGDTQRIAPGVIKEVYAENVPGKTVDPCYGTLLNYYDSVVVLYDDTIRIPHLRYNLPYSGSHKLLFGDARSLLNCGNWKKEITEEKKHSLVGKFTFTFTEQDYQNAR